MKKVVYPDRKTWKELAQRPMLEKQQLDLLVQNILNEVKSKGDKALIELSSKFDGVKTNKIEVSKEEVDLAESMVNEELKKAIQLAKNNIELFHKAQQETELKVETTEGVVCWRKSKPIERVGLYIPGGSAPLFSTVLMLGIPANIAGCKETILCTPPNKEGRINPTILYTAKLVGITKIYKIGGAQAIAAMAYGTETIPNVYKVFGPGNQYVTKAKELIQQEGVSIDMPAGPSEVMVITDDSGIPSFIAADLLSQAEHGADSQVFLISDSERVIDETLRELNNQIELLPRKDIAKKALKNSSAIVVNSIEEAVDFSNQYAPEHLILAMEDTDAVIGNIENAGSVFIGNYSCESAGDYASGTNHTLPTNGFARNYSGVSLDSFVKKITIQQVSEKGLLNIGPAIELMAAAEQLDAHKNAVTIRLKKLKNE